ncbi:tyrosine-type recombinase/integrase [Roseovarius aestuarii]|nr:site-specific integrase [Roseovarius aestuarii]
MKAKNLDVGKYADGQGLWLFKRNRIFGKWVLRIAINGKRREMGLGPWPDVSIVEARERASEARRKVRDGIDPIEERAKRKRKIERLTISKAIESCFVARQAELKNEGHAGRWMSPLNTHVLPKYSNLAIEDVDQHILKEMLEPIWHKKAETASKTLNRLNLTLQHAAALGLDVDLQATMKARALLGKQRHTVTHIPSMPYQDMPKFYKWLSGKSLSATLALQYLILTATRTSEVRFATKDEIEGDVWTLPADRTKTRKERRIPLTNEALKVLNIAKTGNSFSYLFRSPQGKPLSDAAMATFMKREGYDARPHGFRATFRTWVEDQTDTPIEVKESALGHAVDVGVVGAYQRSDRLAKRRVLMEQWAIFLCGC